MASLPNIRTVGAPEGLRIDRTTIRVTTLAQSELDDRAYWHAQSIAARLAQVERLRQLNYGYDPAAARLQRVIGVIQRAPR